MKALRIMTVVTLVSIVPVDEEHYPNQDAAAAKEYEESRLDDMDEMVEYIVTTIESAEVNVHQKPTVRVPSGEIDVHVTIIDHEE